MQWRISDALVEYPDSLAWMQQQVELIHQGKAPETIWCLQHPPLFTSGTSANHDDLLNPMQLTVYEAGRGGEYTYHGPGQLVVYCMMNLKQRKPDVRHYVQQLEEWIIQSLQEIGVTTCRKKGRVGIWVEHENGSESKIAAIGIRLRKWVSFHGFSININPDLSHFSGIIPCGIKEHGVTSLQALGHEVTMQAVISVLQQTNPFD